MKRRGPIAVDITAEGRTALAVYELAKARREIARLRGILGEIAAAVSSSTTCRPMKPAWKREGPRR